MPFLGEEKVGLFVVGQPKSGTTALCELLQQHPQICVSSPKEPNYFCTDFHQESDAFHSQKVDFLIRTPADYAKVFAPKSDTKIFAEGSTNYLYSTTAAQNIFAYNPAAKIVILLREPVSFLHSLHMQYLNETTENEPNFTAALALESSRKTGQNLSSTVRAPSFLYYLERVKYAEQVKRFLDMFGRENVLIFTAEEFKADNKHVYEQIIKHLGLSLNNPSYKFVHESKKPRFNMLNSLLRNHLVKNTIRAIMGEQRYTALQKNLAEKVLMKKAPRPELDETARENLKSKVRPEVEKISQLLNRDLAKEWGY